jgi:hypothetical protein
MKKSLLLLVLVSAAYAGTDNLAAIKLAYEQAITFDAIDGIDIQVPPLSTSLISGEAIAKYDELAHAPNCRKFYSCPAAFGLTVDGLHTIAIEDRTIGSQSMTLWLFDSAGSFLVMGEKFGPAPIRWQ